MKQNRQQEKCSTGTFELAEQKKERNHLLESNVGTPEKNRYTP